MIFESLCCDAHQGEWRPLLLRELRVGKCSLFEEILKADPSLIQKDEQAGESEQIRKQNEFPHVFMARAL